MLPSAPARCRCRRVPGAWIARAHRSPDITQRLRGNAHSTVCCQKKTRGMVRSAHAGKADRACEGQSRFASYASPRPHPRSRHRRPVGNRPAAAITRSRWRGFAPISGSKLRPNRILLARPDRTDASSFPIRDIGPANPPQGPCAICPTVPVKTSWPKRCSSLEVISLYHPV